MSCFGRFYFFFFNDTATTEIYTLSLHDALPISTSFFASATVSALVGPKTCCICWRSSSLSFPPPPPYGPPPIPGIPMRTPPRPPPPPPPLPLSAPRASCIFLRGSSLSSRFSFQAPRIDVRGFTGALCSAGRASGDDGGCGCAAGNGPAGACALAPAGQPATTSPRLLAATKILKFLEFIMAISRVRIFHAQHS